MKNCSTVTLTVTRGCPTRWVSNYTPPPREGNSNKHRSRGRNESLSVTAVSAFWSIQEHGVLSYRNIWSPSRSPTDFGRASLTTQGPRLSLILGAVWMSGVHRGNPHARESIQVVDATKSRLSHTVYRTSGAVHASISRSGVLGCSSRMLRLFTHDRSRFIATDWLPFLLTRSETISVLG